MSDMPQGKQTVEDFEIIQAIQSSEDPIVAAVEIAEIFGLSRQWAYSRLEKLVEEGRIQKKKAGSGSVVYWVEN